MRAGLRSYSRTPVRALGLALLAALGIVLEIFVVKEELFARSEDEFRAAINALENFIREFHGRLPRSRDLQKSAIDLGAPVPMPRLRT